MKKIIILMVILGISLFFLMGCVSGVFLGMGALSGAPLAMEHYVGANARKIAKDKNYGEKVFIPQPYKIVRRKIRRKLEGLPEEAILKNKKEVGRIFYDEYVEGLFIITTIFKEKNGTIVKVWKGEPNPFGSGTPQRKEDKGFEKDKVFHYAKIFGGKIKHAKKNLPTKQTSWGPRRYNMTVIVIVRRANLREGPSTQYRIIKILRYGDKLIAIKETGGGWVMVKEGGIRGYVYKKLIVPKK